MEAVLGKELSGKRVVGDDGTELGTVHNITMDIESGGLQTLLVEPNEESDPVTSDFPLEDGKRAIPIHRVKAVKDSLVVNR